MYFQEKISNNRKSYRRWPFINVMLFILFWRHKVILLFEDDFVQFIQLQKKVER